mgnify:CR=1 FL=1
MNTGDPYLFYGIMMALTLPAFFYTLITDNFKQSKTQDTSILGNKNTIYFKESEKGKGDAVIF